METLRNPIKMVQTPAGDTDRPVPGEGCKLTATQTQEEQEGLQPFLIGCLLLAGISCDPSPCC